MRLAVFSTLIIGGAMLVPGPADADVSTARMVDAEGNGAGVVTVTDSPNGVLIAIELRGLEVGEHGIHVHETGECAPDFEAAGGHFNPDGQEHGLTNPQGMHAGDLPNIFVASDGVAKAHVFNSRVTVEPGPASLLDEDGSAIIVHEDADTYLREAQAGGRVACGVLERLEE